MENGLLIRMMNAFQLSWTRIVKLSEIPQGNMNSATTILRLSKCFCNMRTRIVDCTGTALESTAV